MKKPAVPFQLMLVAGQGGGANDETNQAVLASQAVRHCFEEKIGESLVQEQLERPEVSGLCASDHAAMAALRALSAPLSSRPPSYPARNGVVRPHGSWLFLRPGLLEGRPNYRHYGGFVSQSGAPPAYVEPSLPYSTGAFEKDCPCVRAVD